MVKVWKSSGSKFKGHFYLFSIASASRRSSLLFAYKKNRNFFLFSTSIFLEVQTNNIRNTF